MKRSTAYWMEGGRLRTGSLWDFLRLSGGVISLVGGGGKSTTMDYLAENFCARGLRTAALTTTRILCPQEPCLSMDDCRARWAVGAVAVCGERTGEGKFRAPAPDFLAAILAQAQAVIVEADGAHRRACKAPAAHEPAILPQSDTVVALMGLEVVGRTVEDACHRIEQVCALLGCAPDHVLAPADLAAILLSDQGSRKGVGARDYVVVLNKCDDEARLAAGLQVLAALAARGFTRAALNRYE